MNMTNENAQSDQPLVLTNPAGLVTTDELNARLAACEHEQTMLNEALATLELEQRRASASLADDEADIKQLYDSHHSLSNYATMLNGHITQLNSTADKLEEQMANVRDLIAMHDRTLDAHRDVQDDQQRRLAFLHKNMQNLYDSNAEMYVELRGYKRLATSLALLLGASTAGALMITISQYL